MGNFRKVVLMCMAIVGALILSATSQVFAAGETVSINGGASSTYSTNVNLTISGAAISTVQFSNDGTSWSAEEAYHQYRSWTLSGGYGTKTVFVMIKNTSGIYSTISSSINYVTSQLVENRDSYITTSFSGTYGTAPNGGNTSYGGTWWSATEYYFADGRSIDFGKIVTGNLLTVGTAGWLDTRTAAISISSNGTTWTNIGNISMKYYAGESTMATFGTETVTIAGTNSFRYIKIRNTSFGSLDDFNVTVANIDTTAPTVSVTAPTNNATNVGVTTNIAITFTENVVSSTNYGNITLNGSSAGFTKSISNNVLTITPISNLASSTTYTVSVPASAVKDISDNNLTGAYSFSFTTVDLTSPTISSTSPANNATNVGVATNITIPFSENIASSINYGNITLNGSSSGFTKSISNNVLTMTPSANLASSTTYAVTIPASAVQDTSGNNLAAEYSFSFTTADVIPPMISSTAPANQAVNIDLTTNIVTTFLENIVSSTNYNNITLNGLNTGFSTSINNNILTITPATALVYGTTYTVSIPVSAVKDTSGNNFSSVYNFGFKTQDISRPTIFGSGFYGENALIGFTGTDIAQGNYRIFWTDKETMPLIVDGGATPGPATDWHDTGLAGELNITNSTMATRIISGTELNNTTWKHVTFKVIVKSTDETWTSPRYTSGYGFVESDANIDKVIGDVGHNQIVGGVAIAQPDDVVNNIYTDASPATYRFEFNVLKPDNIEDIDITLDNNIYNDLDIEFRLTGMILKKKQVDGTFALLKDLSGLYVLDGATGDKNRYMVKLGNDVVQTTKPVIIANGSGVYAIEYTGVYRVKLGTQEEPVLIRNEASIDIYTSNSSLPDSIQKHRTNRKFNMDTTVSKKRVFAS